MQVHEITLKQVNEGLGSAFKKAGAVLGTPGALTSAGGYASAMDKYYRDENEKLQAQHDQQKSARLAQQTQDKAKQLAQQWLQHLKSKQPAGPVRAAPSAPTPLKPTGKYATNKNAGQVVNPTPAGVLPEAVSGAPTPGELAKFQQKVAAASAPKTGFGALPGTKPQAGAPVKTQPTKNVLTGTRANEFKTWVDQQLKSPVTGTNKTIGMDQVRKDPNVSKQLAQLLPAIIMKNDSTAIEQYLTIAMTAMQRLAQQARQTQQSQRGGQAPAGEVNPLSYLVSPSSIEQIKSMAQDPLKAKAIKQTLGLK